MVCRNANAAAAAWNDAGPRSNDETTDATSASWIHATTSVRPTSCSRINPLSVAGP